MMPTSLYNDSTRVAVYIGLQQNPELLRHCLTHRRASLLSDTLAYGRARTTMLVPPLLKHQRARQNRKHEEPP